MVLHDPVVRLPPRALSQKDPTRSPAPGGFRSDLSSRSSRGRTLGWHTPSSSRDLLGESHGMPRPIGSKLELQSTKASLEGENSTAGELLHSNQGLAAPHLALSPPAIRTRPFSRTMAVWPARASTMEPTKLKESVAGL